jgi:hypothetical protein
LSYEDLDEVADGQAAQTAYSEALRPETAKERRQVLFQALWGYFPLDTLAR